MTTYLLDLPQDMMRVIFDMLQPWPREPVVLARLRLVCHRFYDLLLRWPMLALIPVSLFKPTLPFYKYSTIAWSRESTLLLRIACQLRLKGAQFTDPRWLLEPLLVTQVTRSPAQSRDIVNMRIWYIYEAAISQHRMDVFNKLMDIEPLDSRQWPLKQDALRLSIKCHMTGLVTDERFVNTAITLRKDIVTLMLDTSPKCTRAWLWHVVGRVLNRTASRLKVLDKIVAMFGTGKCAHVFAQVRARLLKEPLKRQHDDDDDSEASPAKRARIVLED
jgi:hypothetical protein